MQLYMYSHWNPHIATCTENVFNFICMHPHTLTPSHPHAGADQEHKTDEMHTALMEASMDGHVDVARLLLDHGAQASISTLLLWVLVYVSTRVFCHINIPWVVCTQLYRAASEGMHCVNELVFCSCR